jgi:hypothetical protein
MHQLSQTCCCANYSVLRPFGTRLAERVCYFDSIESLYSKRLHGSATDEVAVNSSCQMTVIDSCAVAALKANQLYLALKVAWQQ